MQVEGREQATDVSSPGPPMAGLASTRHAVPFHASARGYLGSRDPKSPTAIQLAPFGHETSDSSLPLAPGLGLVCTCQVLPSHSSARVSRTPDGIRELPTAIQLAPFGHETADSSLALAAGLGVVSSCQVAPFHSSARACWPPAVS